MVHWSGCEVLGQTTHSPTPPQSPSSSLRTLLTRDRAARNGPLPGRVHPRARLIPLRVNVRGGPERPVPVGRDRRAGTRAGPRPPGPEVRAGRYAGGHRHRPAARRTGRRRRARRPGRGPRPPRRRVRRVEVTPGRLAAGGEWEYPRWHAACHGITRRGDRGGGDWATTHRGAPRHFVSLRLAYRSRDSRLSAGDRPATRDRCEWHRPFGAERPRRSHACHTCPPTRAVLACGGAPAGTARSTPPAGTQQPS